MVKQKKTAENQRQTNRVREKEKIKMSLTGKQILDRREIRKKTADEQTNNRYGDSQHNKHTTYTSDR